MPRYIDKIEKKGLTELKKVFWCNESGEFIIQEWLEMFKILINELGDLQRISKTDGDSMSLFQWF